jgi:hypothetical protein
MNVRFLLRVDRVVVSEAMAMLLKFLDNVIAGACALWITKLILGWWPFDI